jgi:hypothetical protein
LYELSDTPERVAKSETPNDRSHRAKYTLFMSYWPNISVADCSDRDYSPAAEGFCMTEIDALETKCLNVRSPAHAHCKI